MQDSKILRLNESCNSPQRQQPWRYNHSLLLQRWGALRTHPPARAALQCPKPKKKKRTLFPTGRPGCESHGHLAQRPHPAPGASSEAAGFPLQTSAPTQVPVKGARAAPRPAPHQGTPLPQPRRLPARRRDPQPPPTRPSPQREAAPGGVARASSSGTSRGQRPARRLHAPKLRAGRPGAGGPRGVRGALPERARGASRRSAHGAGAPRPRGRGPEAGGDEGAGAELKPDPPSDG